MTKNAANPFFGNIRQNMDLIGGVGQMPLKRPTNMSESQMEDMPEWIRTACASNNEGKLVADKFLNIEKTEQRSMQEALSSSVAYEHQSSVNHCEKLQLAGIEKGSKNRYNNIWPFEHSRVKIQGIAPGMCDYINASHVKTSSSPKRYIATQCPIPSTFTVSTSPLAPSAPH